MKIELLHSITHDGQEYLPGLHELPDALAAQFLKFEWAAQPFAAAEVKAGAVREAPGPNLQLEKPAIAKAGVRPDFRAPMEPIGLQKSESRESRFDSAQRPEPVEGGVRSQESEGADAPDEGDTAEDAEARRGKRKGK